MQHEPVFYYPSCIMPYTIYVVRYGESYGTFTERNLSSVYAHNFVINPGDPIDYTHPMFKNLNGHPLVTTDYGLEVMRSGQLPELDQQEFMQYTVVSFPSRMLTRHRVAACGDQMPQ